MKRLINYTAILSLIFLVSCSEQMKDNLPIHTTDHSEEVEAARQYLSDFITSRADAPLFNTEHQFKSKTGNTVPSMTNDDILHNYEIVSIASHEETCGTTPLRDYMTEIREDWTAQDYGFYFFSNLLWDYHYLYRTDEMPKETFGVNGDFTNAMNRTVKSVKRFWDSKVDLIVVAAHSTTFFSNKTLVVKMLNLYNTFGLLGAPLSSSEINDLADAVQAVFGSSNYWKYQHPLLSFNAFAAPANPASPFWPATPAKIVMGDGISDGYDALGLGDVAPQAVLAHEYSHQMQFANNVVFTYTPEGTRRTELMADAMACYYLTHKRGATMNWKRVQQFLQVYYNIGDCQFNNPNHHGTPQQRLRAAQWGYDLAKSQQKNGHISKTADVIAGIDADLDYIINGH